MSDQAATEARRLRERDGAFQDDLSRRDQVPAFGSPSLVAQTRAIASYPTTAQRFYACVPQTVLGTEVEGGPGTLTANPATFFALNLGSASPPLGTTIIATFVDSRWVFRFDG